MQHNRKTFMGLFLLIIAVGFSLAACNYGTSQTPQATPAAGTWTAVAETIVAQLTQAAGGTLPASGTEPVENTPQAGETTEPNPTTPAPSDTQAATPSPQATTQTVPSTTLETSTTPTATLTPTRSPEDPRQSLGDPDWIDRLDTAQNWPLYEDEHAEFTIGDGAMRITSIKIEQWNSWILSWPRLSDFYIEASMAAQVSCSARDSYGLLFRAPTASEGYLFGVACDGRYSLRIWDGEKFTALVNWTPSEHIQTGTGQTNRLGVRAEGEKLALYVNGRLLTEVTDDTYEEGAFGPFIYSADTANFRVDMSEIATWDLP